MRNSRFEASPHKTNLKVLVHSFSLTTRQDTSPSSSSFDTSSFSKNTVNHKKCPSAKKQSALMSKMPEYSFQELKQKQIFDTFNINQEIQEIFCKKSIFPETRLKSFKPSFCICGAPQKNKWWLETDSMKLVAKAYSKYQYQKIDDVLFNDENLLKEIMKKLKKIPKTVSIAMTLKNEAKFGIFLNMIEFLLFNSKKIKKIDHLRVTFSYDENILWAGPKFLLDNIIDYRTDYGSFVEDMLEITNLSKNLNSGCSNKNATDLIDVFNKNLLLFSNLQTFNLKMCSWCELDDIVLLKLIDFLRNVQENVQMKEFAIFFSGYKITDKAIQNMMKTIEKIFFCNLKTFSIGFDTRNDMATDLSLIAMIETLLFLSQKNIITNITLCLISKNITNYGVWTVLEGLIKIAPRIEDLTLAFGNDNKLDENAFKNLKEVLKKAKHLKKFSLGIMSSKIDQNGLSKIMRGINICQNLEYFNLFYSNKGSKSDHIESQIINNLIKWNPKLKEKTIQIFLE